MNPWAASMSLDVAHFGHEFGKILLGFRKIRQNKVNG